MSKSKYIVLYITLVKVKVSRVNTFVLFLCHANIWSIQQRIIRHHHPIQQINF